MTTKIRGIRPTYDGVLVRPLTEDSRTKGGLYIPEVHHGNKPYARGQIVAVGMGRPADSGNVIPLQVAKDDIVLYNRSAGIIFPVNGEHLTLLPETGIFAVLDVEESSLIVVDDRGFMTMPPPVMSLGIDGED
jgi:chaperonin GroES